LSWPLVVLTRLEWCDERHDFFCCWYRKRLKPDNWRKFTYTIHPYAEYLEMKNYMNEQSGKGKKWQPPQDPFLKPYPFIAELLTNPFFDDGKKRELCTFSVRWGIDSVQVHVSDKKMRATASTTAATLPEALALLEEAFVEGHHPWRFWRD